jgi:hypothetical protein
MNGKLRDNWQLSKGSILYFGKPAMRTPRVAVVTLARTLLAFPAVEEAYLPACSFDGAPARPVLVIAINPQERIEDVMAVVLAAVKRVLPRGDVLDILPFSTERLPPESRIAECRLIPFDG